MLPLNIASDNSFDELTAQSDRDLIASVN